MKNLILLSATLLFVLFVNAQIVNIPDANFKAYLVGNSAINTNMDTEIQVSEASAYTDSIIVNSMNIYALIGIEAFTAITYLNCSENPLSTLDVSNNTALKTLMCWNNSLYTLNVTNNTALEYLYCFDNYLQILNLSNNTELVRLECGVNYLGYLVLSNNISLYFLNCSHNQLTKLDLSNNTELKELYCDMNQIDTLDFSNNTALERLCCSYNPLKYLNLTNNTALNYLYFKYTELDFLDLSNNTALTYLFCIYNSKLLSLNLSNNTALDTAIVAANRLYALNLGHNNTLTYLDCGWNQLYTIDVSNCTSLTYFDGDGNIELYSLNMKNGNNINFTYFSLYAANPEFKCIQVDDPVWSTANWMNHDPEVIFSDNCSITVPQVSDIELQVSPNPFSDKINIVFEKKLIYEIKILDLSGKEVITTNVNGTKHTIPTSEILSGIYIIQIISKDGISIKKLIKQ